MPLEERFWEKVDKHGPLHPYEPHLGRCWVWTAYTDKNGYGQIRDEEGRQGRPLKAHRLSYKIHHGFLIPNLQVQHSCNNPPCCNPSHLNQDTPLVNSHYMVKQGRQSRGEKQPAAKLTEEQVAEARRDYVYGSRTHGQYALGRKYGVAHSTIGRIIRGENWR